ncbi:hypothetical protein [Peribacillus frigoritolerans]|uniref:hypothetical protein n=1 Tax=Peribacillus frigoritolerans TaxID=450367 RepID=UPI002E1B0BFE|nr:hypothetical protein [Peribacillus frigoritolerans]
MIKRVIVPRLLPKEVIDPELQEWGKSSDFTDQYKHINDYLKIGRRAIFAQTPTP